MNKDAAYYATLITYFVGYLLVSSSLYLYGYFSFFKYFDVTSYVAAEDVINHAYKGFHYHNIIFALFLSMIVLHNKPFEKIFNFVRYGGLILAFFCAAVVAINMIEPVREYLDLSFRFSEHAGKISIALSMIIWVMLFLNYSGFKDNYSSSSEFHKLLLALTILLPVNVYNGFLNAETAGHQKYVVETGGESKRLSHVIMLEKGVVGLSGDDLMLIPWENVQSVANVASKPK